MISDFQTLLKSSGPQLLDTVGFGKYKGQKLYDIPDQYWKTFCSKNGIDFGIILKKINESKSELSARSGKPVRPALNPYRLRFEFMVNGAKAHLMCWQKQFNAIFGAMKYALLAADIGVGKTWAISEMMRLRWIRDYDKVLVLCPKSVFSSWVDSINDYFDRRATSIIITGSGKEKLIRTTFDRHYYITNYETMKQPEVFAKLKQMGFTWIIADEAHKYLCNPSTQNYKLAMELSSGIEMRYVLTGTPRRSKDENLYGLVTFLDRGERFGASFYKFRDAYFMPSYSYPGAEFPEGYNLKPEKRDEFYQKLSTIMYQVKKRDVLELPELIHEVRQVELTGEAKKSYIEMQKNSLLEIEKYCALTGAKKEFSVEAGIVIARMTKLRQICSGFVHDTDQKEIIRFNGDKLKELESLLEDINEPVIITAVFKEEILQIEELMKKLGYKYGVIAGCKSDKFRNESKDKFSNGELDAMILQEEAGGAGVNGLQNHCSIMIRISSGYSYDTDDQLIGRIDRKGQKKSMVVIRIEAVIDGKPTIDRAIIDTINQKKAGSEYLVENLRKIIKMNIDKPAA